MEYPPGHDVSQPRLVRPAAGRGGSRPDRVRGGVSIAGGVSRRRAVLDLAAAHRRPGHHARHQAAEAASKGQAPEAASGTGDANRDRKVDINDLAILANNWQSTGKVFSQGDFNYDGAVDAIDLGILSANWQFIQAPAAPALPTSLALRTPTRSASRVVSVVP